MNFYLKFQVLTIDLRTRCFVALMVFFTENATMEIPTVKSFCCFDLKTIGLTFGFFQIFIYNLAILITLYLRGFLLIPIICEFVFFKILSFYQMFHKILFENNSFRFDIIVVPIAVSLGWIYGIREVCIFVVFV